MTPWNQLPLWALHVLLWTRTCRGERLRAEWVLLLKTQKPEITMETRGFFGRGWFRLRPLGWAPAHHCCVGHPPPGSESDRSVPSPGWHAPLWVSGGESAGSREGHWGQGRCGSFHTKPLQAKASRNFPVQLYTLKNKAALSKRCKSLNCAESFHIKSIHRSCR